MSHRRIVAFAARDQTHGQTNSVRFFGQNILKVSLMGNKQSYALSDATPRSGKHGEVAHTVDPSVESEPIPVRLKSSTSTVSTPIATTSKTFASPVVTLEQPTTNVRAAVPSIKPTNVSSSVSDVVVPIEHLTLQRDLPYCLLEYQRPPMMLKSLVVEKPSDILVRDDEFLECVYVHNSSNPPITHYDEQKQVVPVYSDEHNLQPIETSTNSDYSDSSSSCHCSRPLTPTDTMPGPTTHIIVPSVLVIQEHELYRTRQMDEL
ncbi:hypothetical protein M3Y98_00502700 [Aphelenchoides besseyi]|nr:hypothetical protein M3Y98_00502700 [Aphelenchoides besseyi]KAI6207771.1 hypothetical protein M3Y96_00044200 [Aphelenchoides besseyi]